MSETLELGLTPQQRAEADEADRMARMSLAVGRAHDSDLRRHLDREEQLAMDAERGFLGAHADFMGRVARGEDTPMPTSYHRGKQWKVSEHLGEPGIDAREILMAACREAQLGRDCGHLLRQFIDQCARDYAEDHGECYE